MPKNSGSFKHGHQMSPEVREKWEIAMKKVREERKGIQPHEWSQESRDKLSKTLKERGHPNAKPMYSERLSLCRGFQYIRIKVSETGKWPFKHRWLMEQHLGRKLKTNEFVHHINEDTLDNRLENLVVISHGKHTALHRTGKNVLGGRWTLKHESCIVCHTTTIPHCGNGMCRRCYERDRAAKLGYWP